MSFLNNYSRPTPVFTFSVLSSPSCVIYINGCSQPLYINLWYVCFIRYILPTLYILLGIWDLQLNADSECLSIEVLLTWIPLTGLPSPYEKTSYKVNFFAAVGIQAAQYSRLTTPLPLLDFPTSIPQFFTVWLPNIFDWNIFFIYSLHMLQT